MTNQPDNEEWRAVPGYEGWYEVSNLGNVKRIMPDIRHPFVDFRLMKRSTDDRGYFNTGLSKEGKRKTFGVHCLVALAFIGHPPTDKHQVNHKNGVKKENVPGNLEYVTGSENVLHSYRVLNKRINLGIKNKHAKVSAEGVEEARKLLAAGVSKKEVAAKFGHHLCWAYRLANNQTRIYGV